MSPIDDVRTALKIAEPFLDVDVLSDHAVRLAAAEHRRRMKREADERAARDAALPGQRLNEMTTKLQGRAERGDPFLDDHGMPFTDD